VAVSTTHRDRFASHRGRFASQTRPFETAICTVIIEGRKKYQRDQLIAANALAHAHYLCEIDSNHVTFIRRNSNKNYTEPHHLVPMSYSDDFDVSLDVEENIVSLCSNCHNQIHYGRNSEELLEKLYIERREVLNKVGIEISFERLLKMYYLI